MKVNGSKKRFRVRQATNMWWGFYQCPSPEGYFIPMKSAHPHFRDTKIKCLYRVEYEDRNKYKLRSRKENN